jgi:predicted permease
VVVRTLFRGFDQDLRVVLRTMRRSPGFVVVAVVILALGSAITGVVFSTVNGWLAVERVIPNASRLVAVAPTEHGAINPTGYFKESAYTRLFQYQLTTVEDLFASRPLPATMSIDHSGVSVRVEAVAGAYFRAIDVPPLLGRALGSEDDRAGGAVPLLLSEATWRRFFEGDPRVVGRAVRLSGVAAEVVGVMPARARGFSIPTSTAVDAWTPIAAVKELIAPGGEAVWAQVFGRLRNEVTLPQAQAEFQARLQGFDAAHAALGVAALPIEKGVLPSRARFAMQAVGTGLVALSAMVLLIACANLANLLLARGAGRVSELALRMALGASPLRVLRLQLAETVVVTTLGGLIGFAQVVWFGRAAGQFTFQLDRGGLGSGWILVDGWVVGYFMLVIASASVAVAIVPAIRTIRLDPGQVLASAGGRGTMTGRFERKRTWLVASQVAGSTVLLVVAGLFVRSAVHASEYAVSFDPARITLAFLDVGIEGAKPDGLAGRYEHLRTSLWAAPNVGAAAMSTGLPASGEGELVAVSADGEVRRGAGRPCRLLVVSPGFFDVLGIGILSGRDFTMSDTQSVRPVAIVNQTAASALWPGREHVGRRLRIRDGGAVEVIGLVRDTDATTTEAPDRCYIFIPQTDRRASRVMVSMTGAGPVPPSAGELATAAAHTFPDASIFNVTSARDYLNRRGGRSRTVAAGLVVLGTLALLIASVGLYGVMSYVVGLRRGEFGIRRVLGATDADIYRLVLCEALRMMGLGIAAGLPVAFAVSAWADKALVGVTSHDGVTYAVVPIVLLVVGVLGAWWPAVKAGRVEPSVALRQL